MHNKIILACLGLLLGACASSFYKGNPQQFETRILSNGSKQFIYRISVAAPAPGPRVDGRENPRQQHEVPGRHDYSRLQNRTARIAAATGYCREGYLQLDYRLSSTVQWIRGECREDATEEDIARFGQQGSIALDNIDR
ncbi:MAG TPA: hypothetical protein VIC08_05540 [Cellvibrionaceae bacterium]